MIGTLGIAAFAPSTVANRSSVALQAQLARYQTELAQWQSCPSCKTPEGQAKIAELTTRIGEIEQRIGAAESANERSPASMGNRPAGAATAFGDAGPAATTALPTDGPVGQRLDVYA